MVSFFLLTCKLSLTSTALNCIGDITLQWKCSSAYSLIDLKTHIGSCSAQPVWGENRFRLCSVYSAWAGSFPLRSVPLSGTVVAFWMRNRVCSALTLHHFATCRPLGSAAGGGVLWMRGRACVTCGFILYLKSSSFDGAGWTFKNTVGCSHSHCLGSSRFMPFLHVEPTTDKSHELYNTIDLMFSDLLT